MGLRVTLTQQSPSLLTRSNLWLAGGLIVAVSLAHGDGTPGAARWALLHVVVVLGIGWFLVHFLKKGEVRLNAAHACAFALFGYALFSLWWSSDPLQGRHQLFNSLGLLAVFLIAPYIRQAIPSAVMVATIGALVLAHALPETIHGGFGNENFLTSFLLIALPFVFFAPSFGLLVGAVVLAYLVFGNGSKQEYFVIVVVGLASLGWATVKGWSHWGVLAGFLGIVAFGAVIGWPLYADSAMARIEIWIDTLRLIALSPVWGHGFGSFMYEYPRLQEWHTGVFTAWGIQQTGVAHHAGAVHNEYLQVVAELGLVGLAGFGALVWYSMRGAFSKDKDDIHLAALASVIVCASLALIDLPAQNAATGLLLALSLGVLAGKGRKVVLIWRGAGALAMVAVLAGTVWLGARSYVAQVEMGQSVEAVKRGDYVRAVAWNEKARQRQDWNWTIRLQYALTFSALLKSLPPETPDAALQDHYYRVGASASPDFPALLIVRFEDLFNTRRNPDEALDVYRRLNTQTPLRANRQLTQIEEKISHD